MQDDLLATPGLSYFVAESLLVSAMQLGVRGSYSSLVATNPRFMLSLYDAAVAGRWEEAIRMQRRIASFMTDLDAFIAERGEGGMDPVADKGLAVATQCLLGHQRCRPPYIGWSDETIEALRSWLRSHYPEFLFGA